MLHRLDFETSALKMMANVPLLLDEKAAGIDVLTRSARFVASCESVALAAQGRLDFTCSQWSKLGMHLLMFSTCQIMVVCTNIESYTIGPGWGSGEAYHWWWILQDLFHGVGGLVRMPRANANAHLARHDRAQSTDWPSKPAWA